MSDGAHRRRPRRFVQADKTHRVVHVDKPAFQRIGAQNKSRLTIIVNRAEAPFLLPKRNTCHENTITHLVRCRHPHGRRTSQSKQPP